MFYLSKYSFLKGVSCIFLFFMVVSCTKKDDEQPIEKDPIIGNWKVTERRISHGRIRDVTNSNCKSFVFWKFESDGTFVNDILKVESICKDETISKLGGNWKNKGNGKYLMSYKDSNNIDKEAEITFEFYDDNKKMKYLHSDGRYVKLTKQ